MSLSHTANSLPIGRTVETFSLLLAVHQVVVGKTRLTFTMCFDILDAYA